MAVDKMIRVAEYLRVSTDIQAKDGDSLRDQQELLDNYIKEHDNMVSIGMYIDDGVSGQKLERGALDHLLDDVREGKVDHIIFTKLDRWFRNLRHYLNTQDLLDKYNVTWTAIKQPSYDTSTAFGQAFVNQTMIWAQLEAQQTSERIHSVFASKVRNKEVITGSAPFGLKVKEKHFVPDETLAPVVQDLYEYYIKTNSIRKTQDYLHYRHGIIRSVVTVRKILKNRIYIGEYKDMQDYCQPIIEQDVFDQVQGLLNKNLRYNTRNDRYYLFSGLLKCKECGRRMAGASATSTYLVKSGEKRSATTQYYKCSKRSLQDIESCANRKTPSEQKIEKYLVENIKVMIASHLEEEESKKTSGTDNEHALDNENKKLEKLIDLYMDELIDKEDYIRRREEIQKKIAELEQPIVVKKDYSVLKSVYQQDIGKMYWPLSPEGRRAFWTTFLQEIDVDRNGRITVVFL